MPAYLRCVRGSATIYDRAIAWYSRSPYVHTEFAWPLDDADPQQWLGAQPSGGVAIRPRDYLGAARPFDMFEADLSDAQLRVLRTFLARQIGKPYDWRAIAGMAIPALDRGHTQAAWFCSELVYYALASAGHALLRVPLKASDRITPRDVAVSLRLTQLA